MPIIALNRADLQETTVDLEDDRYYTQLLLEHSHAMFIAESPERETKLVLDSLWREQHSDGSL